MYTQFNNLKFLEKQLEIMEGAYRIAVEENASEETLVDLLYRIEDLKEEINIELQVYDA